MAILTACGGNTGDSAKTKSSVESTESQIAKAETIQTSSAECETTETEPASESDESNTEDENSSEEPGTVDLSKCEKLKTGNYLDPNTGAVYDPNGNTVMEAPQASELTDRYKEQLEHMAQAEEDCNKIYGNYDNFTAEGYKNGAVAVVDNYWIYKDGKGEHYKAYDPVNDQWLKPGDTNAYGEIYYGYTLDEQDEVLAEQMKEIWGDDYISN